jgi:FkbM family methyltransferase
MRREHPEFTHDHDVFDDDYAVETLLLGEYIGFKPFAGAKVMDIGANVGILTAFWALNGCDVTSYEADPVTYGILVGMLEKTRLRWFHHDGGNEHYDGVQAINAAVYKYDGTIPFLGATGGIGNPLRNGAIQVADMGDKRLDAPSTPCVTLATALGTTVWNCVKFDIEGAEFETLLAVPIETLRNQVKYMQVELHNGWADGVLYKKLIDKLESVYDVSGPVNGNDAESAEWIGRYHWVQCKGK